MYKNGIYFGKLLPPHRGHLYQIIEASTKCEMLHVVISEDEDTTAEVCARNNLPIITPNLRKQWLSQALQDMEHIKVYVLNETKAGIPTNPNGWNEWLQELHRVVQYDIDAYFVGEKEYKEEILKREPAVSVEVFDPERSRFPISSTLIRQDPIKYWDYILGSARPFFCKRVLVTGTESCGKTSLVRNLAKMYNTSWSEEVGRYYARDYLGNDETIFTDIDFTRIAHLQYEQDYHALRTANKVCFFDTDAVVTDFFSKLYLGHTNPVVQSYINPDAYDLVLFLMPDVRWVPDGQRLNGDPEKRIKLMNELIDKYYAAEFGPKIQVIGGNYNERLHMAMGYIDGLLKGDINYESYSC